MYDLRASTLLVGTVVIACVQGCASYGGGHYVGTTSPPGNFSHLPEENAEARSREAAARLNGSNLDRRAFVQAVLSRNPTIESARQGYRAAFARAQGSGAFDDPMLDLGVAPLSLASPSAPIGYEVGISQRLPWFGKRSLESAAATAETAATMSDLETTRRDLALSAVLLYDDYFVAERSLEINAHHVELMGVLRDAATAQFQSGRGSARDSLQAESELAHMERERALLTAQRDVAVAQMNELLHRAPELPLPPPTRELALADTAKTSGSLPPPTLTAGTRSEITAARQRAEAAQNRAARAERDAYPDITISTSYNSMWDTPEHRWMVGLGLSLPIQSGRRRAAADEARAMSAQFESEATRLSDGARTQVFVAIKRLQESAQVLTLFEQRLLPIANEQIEAARAGFINAQSSFTTVLEAEQNLRTAELDYQIARAECDRKYAELNRALGRTPGLDVQSEKP